MNDMRRHAYLQLHKAWLIAMDCDLREEGLQLIVWRRLLDKHLEPVLLPTLAMDGAILQERAHILCGEYAHCDKMPTRTPLLPLCFLAVSS